MEFIKEKLLEEVIKDEFEYCFDKSYMSDETWLKHRGNIKRSEAFKNVVNALNDKSLTEILKDCGDQYDYVIHDAVLQKYNKMNGDLREFTISWLENSKVNGAFSGFPEEKQNFNDLPNDELIFYFNEWIPTSEVLDFAISDSSNEKDAEILGNINNIVYYIEPDIDINEASPNDVFLVYENSNGSPVGYAPTYGYFSFSKESFARLDKSTKISLDEYLEKTNGFDTPKEYLKEPDIIYVGTGDVYFIKELELDVEADFFPVEYFNTEAERYLNDFIKTQNLKTVETKNGFIERPNDETVIYRVNDRNVDYAVAYDSYDKEDVFKKRLDLVDDKLWEVADLLNDTLEMNLDFKRFEHSEFTINIREALIEEMNQFPQKQERKDISKQKNNFELER